ncbi:hypothetical protein IL306_000053 [Fusarium sp. DS 682]|nr:hypothetical protein IL306_000053 [Fusarium sp. DS 682]
MAGALLTDYRTDEAIKMYTDALNINLKLPREQRINIVFLQYFGLCVANLYKHSYAEGHEMLGLAHDTIMEAFGPDTHYDAIANLRRCNLYIAEKKYIDARQNGERALKHFVAEAEYHPTTLATRYRLSTIDLAERKIDDAIQRLHKTLKMCEVAEPTPGTQGQTARSWKLGNVLLDLDPGSDEGKGLRKRAEDIRKQMQGDRYKDLPPEDHSYDMLVAHYFR